MTVILSVVMLCFLFGKMFDFTDVITPSTDPDGIFSIFYKEPWPSRQCAISHLAN